MSTLLIVVVVLLIAIDALVIWLWLRTRRLTREAEIAVPRAGRVQAVRGGTVHWVEDGPPDAPPVVLIHGLGGNLHNFTYALAPLLARDFRVLSLDRPGCGWADRDEDALAALPEQARMIAEFLAARGIERPLVVGHSLGGAVALALALDFPERVGALALLAPLTHPEVHTPTAFKGLEIRSPRLRRAVAATIAAPLAVKMSGKILDMIFAPEPCPEDFLARGGGALGLRPKGFVAASADLAAAAPGAMALLPRYAGLTQPGGVLYGAADGTLSPARHGAALAAAAPAITYEELPGRGHMIIATAPEDCAAFIRRQAARLPGRSAA